MAVYSPRLTCHTVLVGKCVRTQRSPAGRKMLCRSRKRDDLIPVLVYVRAAAEYSYRPGFLAC